jgi:hypothetical protein
MAYDPNIPAPGTPVKDDVPNIQENFSQIKTVFDINHAALTGQLGNEGKHANVILGQQVFDPDMFPPASQGLFAQASALGDATQSELHMHSPQLDPANEDITSAGFGAPLGFAILPSGLIVYWGIGNITTNGIGNSITIDTTLATRPSLLSILFADVQLRTGATATTPIDAFVSMRNFIINDEDKPVIRYVLYKRSAFAQAVSNTILPLTVNFILLGVGA